MKHKVFQKNNYVLSLFILLMTLAHPLASAQSAPAASAGVKQVETRRAEQKKLTASSFAKQTSLPSPEDLNRLRPSSHLAPRHWKNSLLREIESHGAVNNVYYEALAEGATRIYYKELLSDRGGHFWFIPAQDLRGKELEIHYRGRVPQKATFIFSRYSGSAAAEFEVALTASPETQRATVQIPSRMPFDQVKMIRMEIKREEAGLRGDFVIEGIYVLNNE